MSQLICEGACNPGLRVTDEMLFAFRGTVAGRAEDGPVVTPPEELLAALHRLRHTAHRRTEAPHIWRCVVCDRGRRWGNGL